MKLPAPLLLVLLFVSTRIFSAPVKILPADFRHAVQPQVAVAPSGRIHVVFGKDNAIYQTNSPDGHGFSLPVKVGELPKLGLGMRRGPRVTATDKLVLVTAISHTDGNLHAWTSSDDGKTWQENAPINTAPKSAREGLQSLAGDGRGLVAALWLDLRGTGTALWSRISHDGGATWAAEVSVYQSPDGHICECCAPNVAISPKGEIAAMWRNWLGGSRDLYLATSPDGRAFSSAQKLGTGTWKLQGCPMDGGSVAFTPAGKWRAVWRREHAVFASEMAAPETPLARNVTQPVTAYAGRTPLVLWEANGALILQRDTETPTRFAENASAASLASGPETAVIVWESTMNGAKTILLDQIR